MNDLNDLVVSARQKHNGISWSRPGSVALASITALKRNGEIRRWFERRLDYITKDKDNYINNEIDHALHSKKIANLLRLDSQFLRLNNIDRKIEQVGKELRTSHPNARDLRSVIEHLDSIIIQIPYIERGFWSPLNK